MAGWDTLLSLLMDTPTRTMDVRNPAQIGMGNALQAEYARASADPNYGMMSPELQAIHENQLARDMLARTSAAGGGGSGFSQDQVRKSIVDFRISSLARRQQMLDQLRSGMIMANSTPQAVLPAQSGIFPNIARSLGGAASQRLGEDLFDIDPNQSGGGYGTTGYRPNGNMRVT